MNCDEDWEVGALNKTVVSAGKMVGPGNFRAHLDGDGSWLEDKRSGERVPIQLVDDQFWLDAMVAPLDTDVDLTAAPAEQDAGGSAPATRQVHFRDLEDAEEAAPVPQEVLQDAGATAFDLRQTAAHPAASHRGPTGLSAGSGVNAMKSSLRR